MNIYERLKKYIPIQRNSSVKDLLWSDSLWDQVTYILFRSRGFINRNILHTTRNISELLAISYLASISYGLITSLAAIFYIILGTINDGVQKALRGAAFEKRHIHSQAFSYMLFFVAILGYAALFHNVIIRLGWDLFALTIVSSWAIQSFVMMLTFHRNVQAGLFYRVYLNPKNILFLNITPVLLTFLFMQMKAEIGVICVLLFNTMFRIAEQIYIYVKNGALIESIDKKHKTFRASTWAEIKQDVFRVLCFISRYVLSALLIIKIHNDHLDDNFMLAIFSGYFLILSLIGKIIDRPFAALAVNVINSFEQRHFSHVLNVSRSANTIAHICASISVFCLFCLGMYFTSGIYWPLQIGMLFYAIFTNLNRIQLSTFQLIGQDEFFWRNNLIFRSVAMSLLILFHEKLDIIGSVAIVATLESLLWLSHFKMQKKYFAKALLEIKHLRGRDRIEYTRALRPVNFFHQLSIYQMILNSISETSPFLRVLMNQRFSGKKMELIHSYFVPKVRKGDLILTYNMNTLVFFLPKLKKEERASFVARVFTEFQVMIKKLDWYEGPDAIKNLFASELQEEIKVTRQDDRIGLLMTLEDYCRTHAPECKNSWYVFTEEGHWRNMYGKANLKMQRELTRISMDALNTLFLTQYKPSDFYNDEDFVVCFRPMGQCMAIWKGAQMPAVIRDHKLKLEAAWLKNNIAKMHTVNKLVPINRFNEYFQYLKPFGDRMNHSLKIVEMNNDEFNAKRDEVLIATLCENSKVKCIVLEYETQISSSKDKVA
jgi:hypothetical protein